MRYYPVFLDLADKPVVVIGGGNIALQKMDGLLDAGAKVTVISPELNERMTELRDAGKLHARQARLRSRATSKGYELVFVATDDHEENRRVWQEGRERHIWVNAVDDIPNCDFIMPGIVRKGELIIAISTSGNEPGHGPQGARRHPGVPHPRPTPSCWTWRPKSAASSGTTAWGEELPALHPQQQRRLERGP